MATNFPTGLDDNSTLPSDRVDGDIIEPEDKNNASDAIVALETKVGIDDSADTDSLDYRVGALEGGGSGIAGTLLDAKGDLISASAADTPTRVAVGADRRFLVADSDATSGIKWRDLPFILLKDYATGDGDTDDTAAVQAVADGITNKGATVLVEQGQYKHTSVVDWDSNGAKQVRIIGEARSVINEGGGTSSGVIFGGAAIVAATASQTLWRFGDGGSTDQRGPIIENIGFIDRTSGGNPSIGQTCTLLHIRRYCHSVLKNIGIRGGLVGIKMDADRVSLSNADASWYWVEQTYATTCLNPFWSDANGTILGGDWLIPAGATGIYHDPRSGQLKIIGLKMDGPSSASTDTVGIHLLGQGDVVDDCTFENIGTAIILDGDSGVANSGRFCKVDGSHFTGGASQFGIEVTSDHSFAHLGAQNTFAGSLTAVSDAGTSTDRRDGAATPGGELGGTYLSPTIDATHSGSTHSAATDTHIADTSDAHDASAVSVADSGNNFTGTDVEAVLAELAGLSGGAHDHDEDDLNPDIVTIEEYLKFSGVATLSATGSTDDYAAGAVGIIRYTGAGTATLTGITGGAEGRFLVIYNANTTASNALTLQHDNGATSTAGNRFNFSEATSVVLRGRAAILLEYDATAARWVSAGAAPSVSSAGANITIDAAGTSGTAGARPSTSGHGHQLSTYSTAAAAVGTAAAGTSTTAPSRGDHVHPTGAGTPSTQAFGDAAATGTGPAASMTDHKHAMPADPTATHVADTTTAHAAASVDAVAIGGGGTETVKAVGATSTTETIGLTLADGNVQTFTVDANCVFTMPSGLTSGVAKSFTAILTDSGGPRTITFTGVKWSGGFDPTSMSGASAIDIFSFLTIDGGTTWYGFVGGTAMAT